MYAHTRALRTTEAALIITIGLPLAITAAAFRAAGECFRQIERETSMELSAAADFWRFRYQIEPGFFRRWLVRVRPALIGAGVGLALSLGAFAAGIWLGTHNDPTFTWSTVYEAL